MKIIDALVEDRRHIKSKEPVEPWIVIRVDAPVEEMGDIIQPNVLEGSRYRLIPCGPFYALEYCIGPAKNGMMWDDVRPEGGNSGSIGEFNEFGWIDHQLIYVKVEDPEGEELDLYMDVKRARRLLRKYFDTYVIIVDEQAALLGDLQWRVELSSPVCYGGADRLPSYCRNVPGTTIVYRGAHLNVCNYHLPEHQNKMREFRQAN